MDGDVSRELEKYLNLFMLRRNRDNLCNPVIAVSPPVVDGLTYPLLTALRHLGPMSVSELGEQVGMERSNVSRYVMRLVDAGYVRKRSDPADARSTILTLTPKGSRLAERLHSALSDHLAATIATWPAGLAESLAEGIRRLIAESA